MFEAGIKAINKQIPTYFKFDVSLSMVKVIFCLAALVCLTYQASAFDVVCYFESWTFYSQENKIDLNGYEKTCTHLIYSFAKLDEATNTIQPYDTWLDLNQKGYERATSLRKQNPNLKVMIAIGGWNEGSDKYSKMVLNPASRATFVRSVVSFLTKYNFDGIDIDWEYPTQRGGQAQDRANFAKLCNELSVALRPKRWLLTAATNAGPSVSSQAYDFSSLRTSLDKFHIMTYDLHGSWDGKAYHQAPIRRRPQDPSDFLTIDSSVAYYLQQGIRKSSLIKL